MSELKNLAEKVHQLRMELHTLICTKENLLDPEIITVSRMIDTLLNEYEILIAKKEKDTKDNS